MSKKVLENVKNASIKIFARIRIRKGVKYLTPHLYVHKHESKLDIVA